jgi:hypothetical protein
MVKNPYEIVEDGEDQGPVEGMVAEKQPQKGTRPVCPRCDGRVHQVMGVDGEARWVCMVEGGVVTPRWIEDPLAALPVRFAPAPEPLRARPRGLRPGDIQVAVRATRPR